MAEIVLRVRLTGGDHMDVTYEESDTVNADEVVEHVVSYPCSSDAAHTIAPRGATSTSERSALMAEEVVEYIVSTLAQDSGVLRTRHGDRLILLYGRGVAAVEVAPRGAVV